MQENICVRACVCMQVSEKGGDGVAFRKLEVRSSPHTFHCWDFFFLSFLTTVFPSCVSAEHNSLCATHITSHMSARYPCVCRRRGARHRRHQGCELSGSRCGGRLVCCCLQRVCLSARHANKISALILKGCASSAS